MFQVLIPTRTFWSVPKHFCRTVFFIIITGNILNVVSAQNSHCSAVYEYSRNAFGILTGRSNENGFEGLSRRRLTKSMTYETRGFIVTFTRTLQ